MTDYILEQAITAIKSGNKQSGKSLLIDLLKSNPNNEEGWLWLASTADSTQERQHCLERVLALNPNNPDARRQMNVFQAKALKSEGPPDEQRPSTKPVQPLGQQEIENLLKQQVELLSQVLTKQQEQNVLLEQIKKRQSGRGSGFFLVILVIIGVAGFIGTELEVIISLMRQMRLY